MENNNQTQNIQENAIKYTIYNSISAEAIIVLDLDDLIIVETNNSFSRIFGYPQSAIIGKSIVDFIPQNLHKSILTKLSLDEIKLFETSGIKKDGNLFPIEMVGKKIDIQDKPSYFIVIRDITDKKANKEKNKLIKEYKVENELAIQSAAIKKQFLVNISHEMRTPLTGIVGMVGFLQKTPLDATQFDYLFTIKNSSEMLYNLMKEIIDISEMGTNDKQTKVKVFSFQNLCNKITGLFNVFNSNKKNINLYTNVAYDLPESIKTDENKLIQIFSNLISSAVRYTQSGSITVNFVIHDMYTNKVKVKCEIIDTGKTFDAKTQQNLFLKDNTFGSFADFDYDESGLSILIAKDLVALLNGEIGIDCKEEQGNHIWFTFEAEQVSYKDELFDELQNENYDELKMTLSVLLVEDKFINQKVISMMLENVGCTVDIANNGKEALDMFKVNKYDVIFMDIQMPIMDGITAIKELNNTYAILPPIIGLSAVVYDPENELIPVGMADYLVKPITSEKLYEKLIKWQPIKK